VIGRFDDDFMGADAIHLVEKTFALAVKITFDTKRWEFVGYHAYGPARGVGASVAPAINKNFRRRFGLMPWAKWAVLAIGHGSNAFTKKIVWALSTLRGNDHPPASDRVFSQLRQSQPPRRGLKNS
jgi:hypothetical protein